MEKNQIKNQKFVINGCKEKQIVLDLTFDPNQQQKGLVIFVHGFKGFKDWGTHPLLAEYFATQGFSFLKFNFSHNGMSLANLLNFTDLEAFGHNTFSMELEELHQVIDYCISGKDFATPNSITLIGHSKGGGISILETARNNKVDNLITWASTADFSQLWKEKEVELWQKEGVRYVINGRTKQQMPQYKVILEDFEQHEEELNILKQAKKIQQPWLIVHGTMDPAVSFRKAKLLKESNPNAILFPVEDADHVFGGRHPFSGSELPPDLQKVSDECIRFINENEIR